MAFIILWGTHWKLMVQATLRCNLRQVKKVLASQSNQELKFCLSPSAFFSTRRGLYRFMIDTRIKYKIFSVTNVVKNNYAPYSLVRIWKTCCWGTWNMEGNPIRTISRFYITRMLLQLGNARIYYFHLSNFVLLV